MSFGKFRVGLGLSQSCCWLLLLLLVITNLPAQVLAEPTPEMINEAMRRSGLSREEVLRLYAENKNGETPSQQSEQASEGHEPGRQDLGDIDDSRPGANQQEPSLSNDRYGLGTTVPPSAILPFQMENNYQDSLATSVLDSLIADSEIVPLFGHDFFRLDEGLFTPLSFGPVPQDYELGVGDEVVVDVWGGVELRLTRLVDRDGTIILPTVGRIHCTGRSLQQVSDDIHHKLALNHSRRYF